MPATEPKRIPPKRPSPGKPNGTQRPKPNGTDADSSLSLLPKLDALPEKLPKAGITAVVHRSKLQPDPRNPRTIDPYAAQGLKDSIRRTGGLIEDPIWNRRTGYLVGGHQRLTQEDKRRGTQDYSLAVKVVDWDDAFALEVNVALNNPNTQGQYDLEMLNDLIRRPDFDFRNAGFDAVNLEDMYLNAGMTFEMPGAVANDETEPESSRPLPPGRQAAQDAADDIADQLDEADAAKASERSRADRNDPQAIRDRRQEYQQQAAWNGQTDVGVTIVFASEDLKRAFMRYIGKPEMAERVDGVSMCRHLQLDIPEIEAAMPPKSK